MVKYLFVILIVVAVLIACHNNNGKENRLSDDFNELVLYVHSNVVVDYPDFVFYEAFARLSDEDSLYETGCIDPSSLVVVYGCEGQTMQATIDSCGVKYSLSDYKWTEDIVMTPHVPISLCGAISTLKSNGINVEPGSPVVLRHQLWYNEAEPRYFIGGLGNRNTVNVYTGKVNVPLQQPNDEWLADFEMNQNNDTVCDD